MPEIRAVFISVFSDIGWYGGQRYDFSGNGANKEGGSFRWQMKVILIFRPMPECYRVWVYTLLIITMLLLVYNERAAYCFEIRCLAPGYWLHSAWAFFMKDSPE
jgi:hypothetical protein